MKSETFHLKINDLNNLTLPHGDRDKSVAILFCSPKIFEEKSVLNSFIQRNKHIQLIGCSSGGEIYGSQLLDDSITLAYMEFKDAKVLSHRVQVKNTENSFECGEKVSHFFNQTPHLRSLFVLSDGTKVNGSHLIAGINSHLSKGIVCTGGMAADGDRFKTTWVLDNSGCYTDSVVAIGFYGESLIYGHGSHGGWDVFGPERVITKSQGNVLFEIDDEPALDLYKKYLGHMAYKLPSSALQFPLQIQPDRDKDIFLVRTILSVSEEDKSMTFAGDIVQGATARLMKTNFDRLIEGSAKSAEMAAHNNQETNSLLSIAISCVGRRWVLGERCEEEIEATLASHPNVSGQIGFYSYGEIAPTKFHSCSELLNQTMTITTIGEKCA